MKNNMKYILFFHVLNKNYMTFKYFLVKTNEISFMFNYVYD